jgi:F plasmid transfer operon, TraF, protein
MKKIILIIFITLILTGFSFGQTILDDPLFAPVRPEVIARGNAVTATVHGYDSLFTNPAGFSKEDGSFTLLTLNANPYFAPTAENMDGFTQAAGGDITSAVNLLSSIVVDNGIGANINTGIAIVGKGLGLGIVADVDAFGTGKTTLGTEVDVVGTISAIAGMSFAFHPGPFDIHLGGDLKGMYRMKMDNVTLLQLMDLAEGGTPDVNILSGIGIGIDLGTIVDYGSFSFGLSVRDIGGTKFAYNSISAADFETGIPVEVAEDYRIPMTISTGFGYHPDLGILKWIIDPTFNVEYQHVFYADPENTPSFWTGVHAGTEIKVLRFMKVRAGINQGYITAGIGAKILFIDINMAYFTREMGEYAGVNPNSGMSLEFAIRF